MIQGNLAGKYRLLATLGHGGMADVFLACAQGPVGFNKLLVIKELRPSLAHDPDFLDMFLDEARLAAQLNHPNIVQTYETLASDGRYFIAMEYLDGQPLNRILAERKGEGLPWQAGVRLLCEALRGLHHAHELRDYGGALLGIVHRDVTPHNIVVTYDGQIKLLDFGIAKATHSTDTRVGMLKGKVGYMAPEQARSDAIDQRTDIFGMGVVLWELLGRRRMWRGHGDVAILNRLAAGDIPALSDVASDLPFELLRICERATAADPAARFASAEAFRQALEACLAEQSERWDPRRVGALVAEAFAAERERMRSVIQLQLMDSTRLPAVLEHTYTSRSGSLDPRHDSVAPRLTPSPTPADFVINVPTDQRQELDTTVFPHGRAARRWRKARTVAVALGLVGVTAIATMLLSRSAPPPFELGGVVAHDTRLTAERIYVLDSDVRVAAGVTLTLEPGAQLVAQPGTGARLVLEPGARVVTAP